jgi:fermentation-respiration switch protein FrsA (DUF1100 family)
MKSVKIKTTYWDIAADLHFPPDFDESKKYPAIISAHPIGSCKEQTSGNVYGQALAKEGFVVIAFDRSFQGSSGGEPRSIEDPTLTVEDFRHVADYLVTLPYVDENRIGVLGICGGGGYAINAAMTERRIKAVGTVTGVNYGRLMREGFSGYNPIGALEAMAKQRTAEARGQQLRVDDLLPPSPEEAKKRGLTEIDVYEATEYYRTPRGQKPRRFENEGTRGGRGLVALRPVRQARASGAGPREAGSVLQEKPGLSTIDLYRCLSDEKSSRTWCRWTDCPVGDRNARR